MFKALFYAYVLGGLTFLPLLVFLAIFITVYTSVPVGDPDMAKGKRKQLQQAPQEETEPDDASTAQQHKKGSSGSEPELETNDLPTTRKGWLTMRRTFEETEDNTSYVTLVRSFIDSRSKDPRRSRPKDMWFVVLKRNILYLYEDEQMTECGAVIELSRHEVVIFPEGLPDAELFAKRNAICIRQKPSASPNMVKEMKLEKEGGAAKLDRSTSSKEEDAAHDEFDPSTPWFMFVRSAVDMEDWYLSLVHASSQPAQTPTLLPLRDVFDPRDMHHLVSTLDDQPDVIPMRWLNALIGRIFFSHYKTHALEAYIIGRLMKKINIVKRPQFLTSLEVTEVSVGNRPPMLSKPMLKELSKEGDASMEVHFQYKGEIRITVEATAVIDLGARFKSYTVKLALAVVVKELEGNLLVKVKRPPSNRIWYAFTKPPRMVMDIEPIVSDRQITWGMILSTIETQIKQVLVESVVLPNMDDISYFDSLPFSFRGGIWSDASRAANPMPHMQPTAPESDDDSQTSVPSGTEDPAMVTSLSEEAISAHNSLNDPNLPRVVVDDPSDSVENNSRRKKWFSTVRSEDGKSNLSAPDLLYSDSDGEGSRGRSETFDEFGVRKRSLSRQSTRSAISSKSTKAAAAVEGAASDISHSLRRSISRHFNRENTDASLSLDASSSDRRHAKSSPGTPQQNPDSLPPRSVSPPSFFSALKSKAGDKQALSNTAKEAMRKWGVNWGNKKESASTLSVNDEVSQDSPSGVKPRASYAEVRAAVAERKEKDKVSQDEAAPSGSDSSSNGESTITPSIVAATARLSGPRIATKKSQPSMSIVNTDTDVLEEYPKPAAPVRVQPQAPKMMMIPGIHASHRNEVQALGYVAPSPPPPPTTTLESKLNLKNPTIQTVYRFWKSPSISSPFQDESSASASAAQDSGRLTAEPDTDSISIDLDDHESGSQETPLAPASPRPTPPPLPPRSTPVSTGVKKATDESEPSSTWTTSPSPPAASASPKSSSSSNSVSPASAALKSIVTKDDETRNLIEAQKAQSDSEDSGSASASRQHSSRPSIEGALNASRSKSPTLATASSTPARARSPPPLPPRRASIQIAAN